MAFYGLMLVLIYLGQALCSVSKIQSNVHPVLNTAASMQNLRTLIPKIDARHVYSPKRSTMFAAIPGNMAAGSGHQPSLVAIPLYFRNDKLSAQKTPLLYDMFMSALADSSQYKAPVAAVAGPNYFPGKQEAMSISPLKPEAGKYLALASKNSPAQALKVSASSYSGRQAGGDSGYDQQAIAAAGYAAANPASHLNMAAGYGQGKPVSGQGASAVKFPGLKPVAFDDHQKAAFNDFTGALEGFELKALTNSDLYDLPHIPSGVLTGAAAKKGQSSGGQQQSYGQGSQGGQGYGGGQSGQSYGSSGQSYGQTANQGYSQSGGGGQYDPTGYGYSVGPSPSAYGQSSSTAQSGGYGQSSGYSPSSQSSGSYGGGSSGDYGGSQGSSQGYGQQSSGSYGGGSSQGAAPAYMTSYPIENNFGAEVHAAYQQAGSPTPYVSSHNPFGDVSAGGQDSGSDYSSGSSYSAASSLTSGYEGGQSYGSSPSYSQPSQTYSNAPQSGSSSYSVASEDTYGSSSSASQSYSPASYSAGQSSSPSSSYGQSPSQSYSSVADQPGYSSALRGQDNGQSYQSRNYAASNQVMSQNYGAGQVNNQAYGASVNTAPAYSQQDNSDQSYNVNNNQEQSSGTNSQSKSQTQSSYGNEQYNSFTGPSYQIASQTASFRPQFYPITSANAINYGPQKAPSNNNYEASVVNDYYADPDCPKEGEYGSSVAAPVSSQASGSSSSSSSAPISSYAASSKSAPQQTSTGSRGYSSASDQSKYASTIAQQSGQSSPAKSLGLTSSSNVQAYEPEELDPSKLDLKIIHLPVSVLRKLVSSGDVTLNQQLY